NESQCPTEQRGHSVPRRTAQRQALRPDLGQRLPRSEGGLPSRLRGILDTPLVEVLAAAPARFSRPHLSQRHGFRLAVARARCRCPVSPEATWIHARPRAWTASGRVTTCSSSSGVKPAGTW